MRSAVRERGKMGVKARERRKEGGRKEGKEGGREEGRKEGGREAGRSSCVYGKRKTYYDVPTFSPEWRQTQVVCGQEEATPTSV